MTDPTFYLASGLTALAALALVSLVALRGWNSWIALKRDEMLHAVSAHGGDMAGTGHAGSRIELADLKERIRKLEAIAAGVDL
jgi:cytochrome oxidase Cu insertion factor (SCO1/SenC/PrrC family)